MDWIRPNTITGSVAQGKKYFRREDIEDKIWHEVSQGNSVLFLAPRRVGKSSIVSYMAENQIAGFVCRYEVIQAESTIQGFFNRLINMIHDSLTGLGKTTEWFTKWWNSWTIKTIGKDKVDLGSKDINYRDTFFDLLDQLKTEQIKVILFLDEFPDVVLNIFQKEGDEAAKQLLADIRTLCHNKRFKNIFILVFLGSVGLSHVVKKVTGRNDKINQLHTEHLPPLTKDQSRAFLNFLINGATIQLSQEIQEFLLNKIGNYIPYYIQLLIEECDEMLYHEKRPVLTQKDVVQGYNNLLKKNDKFEDWDSRLTEYFKELYPFLHNVLSKCADQNKISLQEIFDIAVKHNIELQWKASIDDILIADGYIYELNGQYYFNSPLLRDWWKSRHPIMKK